MATYWAAKPSLPFVPEKEKSSPEYLVLLELQEAMKGLTLAQGAPDIFGCFEMVCALHYHYLNFMRVIQKKISLEVPHDAPDERFEAVAYIGRIGQLAYFSKSRFVCELMGEGFSETIAWVHCLIPFRHKYSAHRERDKPLKGTNEGTSLDGELALGALGGKTFAEKYSGAFEKVHVGAPNDHNALMVRQYEYGYVVFQLLGIGNSKSLIVERDHPHLFSELALFMRCLIDKAKMLPRE